MGYIYCLAWLHLRPKWLLVSKSAEAGRPSFDPVVLVAELYLSIRLRHQRRSENRRLYTTYIHVFIDYLAKWKKKIIRNTCTCLHYHSVVLCHPLRMIHTHTHKHTEEHTYTERTLLLGISIHVTKLVECPVVDSVPVRVRIL